MESNRVLTSWHELILEFGRAIFPYRDFVDEVFLYPPRSTSAVVVGGRAELLVGVWIHSCLIRKSLQHREALDAESSSQLFVLVRIDCAKLSRSIQKR